MKAAPGDGFGNASGPLRTFANVGMVFLVHDGDLDRASQAVSRQTASAIFLGTGSLPASARAALTAGLHATFYASTR